MYICFARVIAREIKGYVVVLSFAFDKDSSGTTTNHTEDLFNFQQKAQPSR